MRKYEIDVYKLQDNRYALELDGERILVQEHLGAIVERIERELKKAYNIEKKQFWRFWKK